MCRVTSLHLLCNWEDFYVLAKHLLSLLVGLYSLFLVSAILCRIFCFNLIIPPFLFYISYSKVSPHIPVLFLGYSVFHAQPTLFRTDQNVFYFIEHIAKMSFKKIFGSISAPPIPKQLNYSQSPLPSPKIALFQMHCKLRFQNKVYKGTFFFSIFSSLVFMLFFVFQKQRGK